MADDSQSHRIDWQAVARATSTWLFGLLLVWSFLMPVDATSVFMGQALAQNLFWLLAAVLCAIGTPDEQRLRTSGWQWIAGAVLLIWILASTFAGGAENNPRPSWNGFWQLMALVACYWCARTYMQGVQARRTLLTLCLVACVGLSVHGAYQLVIDFPASRAAYESDPDAVLARIPLNAPPGSAERLRFESRLNSPEPYATFALANSLAAVLSAGLILLGATAIPILRRQVPTARFGSSALALCVGGAVVVCCWLLARSNAAYLAFLGALLGFALQHGVRTHIQDPVWQRRIRNALLVSLGLLGLGIVLAIRSGNIDSIPAPRSLVFRFEYWVATWQMIEDHWLLGVGLGNFQAYYPHYKLEVASETIADPHNWFLDIAATLSLPMAVFVSGWLFQRLVSLDGQNTPDEEEVQNATSKEIAAMRMLDRNDQKFLILGALFGGALCWLLLVMLLGLSVPGTLLGWMLAGVFAVAIWPATEILGRHVLIAQTAALSMVIALLVSGSWQASGLAIPLVILLAATHRPTCSERKALGAKQVKGRSKPAGNWLSAVLPAVGLVSFIFQAWLPTNSAWSLTQQAQGATAQQQIELANEALQADPLDTQALAWMAGIRSSEATGASRGLFATRATATFEALGEWLERDRHKFVNWSQAGNYALNLAAAASQFGLDEQVYLDKALDYYRTAVEKYPSGVDLRIQLAATAARRELWGEFQAQVKEAERISDLTPHADKKLENQLIWLPWSEIPAEIRSETAGMVPAEPLIRWLRTQQSTPSF